jgi:hypothetical protein
MREKRVEIEQALLSDLPPDTKTHFFHATDSRIQQPIDKVLSLLDRNIVRAQEFIQTKEFELFDSIKEFFIKIQALKFRMAKEPGFKQMSYWMLFTFDEYIAAMTILLEQLFKIFTFYHINKIMAEYVLFKLDLTFEALQKPQKDSWLEKKFEDKESTSLLKLYMNGNCFR